LESCSPRPANEFLAETLDEWQATRPAIKLKLANANPAPVPDILAEPTLKQALHNVLNNAADASPEAIEVRTSWDESGVTVDILDAGPGLSEEALSRASHAVFSTKPKGAGLGLFLARAALERVGGKLALTNRATGGAHARILLPVRR
jgi:two-component system, sensor histidine kinase RegB